MNPAETAAIEIEEPDWGARFEEHKLRWPKLPPYLAADSAFEATLSDWRRFHSTPLENGKRMPAKAVDGMIALAELKIFPPRSLIQDMPIDGMTGYQHDDHMWLSVASEQWRIVAVEDRMLMLERALEDKPATMQIDLSRTKWTNYVQTASKMLEAMRS